MTHNLFFPEIIGYTQKSSSPFLKMNGDGRNIPIFTPVSGKYVKVPHCLCLKGSPKYSWKQMLCQTHTESFSLFAP